MKELKDMDYREMVNCAAGASLDSFVNGMKFRDVIASACMLALQWKSETESKAKNTSKAKGK